MHGKEIERYEKELNKLAVHMNQMSCVDRYTPISISSKRCA